MLIASALFIACQDDGSYESFPKEENQLVPQAREFYEKVITEAAEKGILVQDRNMSPGEVTPRWHEAYLKYDSRYEYVYVPIHAEKNYIRQVEMKKKGRKKTYNVYLSQILCVRKDRGGNYSAAYITMMPSLSHYRRNKNRFTEKVIESETLYGDFSGYVAYNNIVTSRLMVVDKVEKGKFQWALSRETPLEKDSLWTLYKEVYKNIYSFNMSLTRHTIDGGSLEEVEITPDTYYCPICKANMPNDHICSDYGDSNESGPLDGDDDGGSDVGGNGGSGGGGSGGGGSSWGGGGGSSSITPPPSKKPDVCVKVASKLNSESFNKLVKTLGSLLEQFPQQEIALFYKYDKATGEYKVPKASYSEVGVPGINVDANAVKSMDGYIHSHYEVGKSTLPIFSADDLLTVGQLYENSAIDKLGDFSTGLYTKDGVFFLEVTDADLYSKFYNTYSDEAGLDLLITNYSLYGIVKNTQVDQAVKNFVSMLESTKSGLTLVYKLHESSTMYYTDKGRIDKY